MPNLVLTAQAIAGPLAPGDYMDLTLPNFGLRVRGTARTWFVRVRENGTRVRVVLGPAAVPGRAPDRNAKALTLKEARAKAATLLGLAAEGTVLRPRIALDASGVRIEDLSPATMTVAALATVFLADHKATWSASWYGDVRWYLDEIVLPAWGGRLAKDITRREVKDLVKRYAVRAPVAANMCFRAIRKMFRWASREEYLDGAPMVADLDEPTKTGTGRDRVLSPDEVRAVWIALAVRARRSPKAGRPRAVVDLWRLRLLTAQRETALRSIRWTWVNVEAGTVEFPARVMKRKMQPPHVLPLGPLALRVLRRRRAFADPTDLLVFGTRRGETRTPGLTKGAPLALPDFQGKDLRRTAATLMAEHGVTDFDISRVLNHARKTDEGVTGIYNKYRYLAEKRRALETLDRAVSTILHPTRRAGAVVAFKRA